MIASEKWTNFSKLVETVMRVKRSLSEKKQEIESFRGATYPFGVVQEQFGRGSSRRFVSSVSSKGHFKP